ncbi:hypothetical protein EGO52_03680 [Curtobacterium flaccumfaciens]|nr:hypothetical protein [Curtobacterium flaccumfaciens]
MGLFDWLLGRRGQTSIGEQKIHPDIFGVLLQHLQPAPADVRSSASIATATPRGADASPAATRAWATANGYQVGVRGRLPGEVIAACNSSTSSV